MSLSQTDWQIRTYIYTSWIQSGKAPSRAYLASKFSLSEDNIQRALERLHAAHHIFLEPETRQLRMANPLSAIETDYRVKVAENWIYANCAWDTLGIAAMTNSDVTIQAKFPLSDEETTYHVRSTLLITHEILLVHFSTPVNRWYDDLIHT